MTPQDTKKTSLHKDKSEEGARWQSNKPSSFGPHERAWKTKKRLHTEKQKRRKAQRITMWL